MEGSLTLLTTVVLKMLLESRQNAENLRIVWRGKTWHHYDGCCCAFSLFDELHNSSLQLESRTISLKLPRFLRPLLLFFAHLADKSTRLS